MLSLDFFKKLNWTFGLIAIGVMLGVIAFSAMVEVKDLDLWLHLKMGEFIFRSGYVPSVDVLSCSFAGKPWIDHEWLFQLIAYLVQAGGGMDGLIYMQVAVVALTFLIFFIMTYDGDRQLLIVPFFFLILHVYMTRFTIRPDIFSLLFFAAYFYILSLHLNKRWSLWVLFALQVLWSNIHGYALFGIVFVLIGLCSEWTKRHVPLPYAWNEEGRLTDEEYRRLRAILVAVILASFLNPYTFQGALYPWGVLFGAAGDQKIFFENITELQRPLAWATLFDLSDQGAFKALIMASGLSFIFNRRKIDVSALLLWAVFLAFSLSAVRNMVYFAFAAYAVLMMNARHLRLADMLPFTFKDPKFLYLAGTAASIALTVMIMNHANDLSFYGYYDFDRYERKSEFLGVSQRNFPHKAADFLVKSGIRGNFFNDFNSGAYLIGRTYPNIRVYMDGRTELRGADFFRTYKKIWDEGDEALFNEAVEKYHLTGAFINTISSRASAKMLKMLFARKDWRPVYFDNDAVIFLRDVPENAAAIKAFGLDLAASKPGPLDFCRLGLSRVVPYHQLARAYTLRAAGFNGPALAEVDMALKAFPSYDDALELKADILFERGAYEDALQYYRQAGIYAPDRWRFEKKLARVLLEKGDLERAATQAKKAVDMASRDAEARFILAQVLAKSRQYQKGYDILGQAFLMAPKAFDDVLKFGDACLADGEPAWALKAYALAVKRDTHFIAGYDKVARAYEALGEKDKALMTLKRALLLAPDDQAIKKRVEEFPEQAGKGKE